MDANRQKMISSLKYLASLNIGYNQYKRASLVDFKNHKLLNNTETDCSFGICAAAWYCGLLSDVALKRGPYSGNAASILKSEGWKIYPFTWEDRAVLEGGEIVGGTGHVVGMLSPTLCLSFEKDEHGKAHGGKPGDQTGLEGRTRKFYPRSEKWKWRAVPPVAKKTESDGTISNTLLAKIFYWTSVEDTSRISEKILEAKKISVKKSVLLKNFSDFQLSLQNSYIPVYEVPTNLEKDGLIFTILGSGLKADGTMTKSLIRRLEKYLEVSKVYPEVPVIVSGGKPQKGITEAQAMKNWLVSKGISGYRIFTENSSSSTVGNAKNSLELIESNKFTKFVVISEDYHLRRASILFDAAILKRRLEGKITNSAQLTPIAAKSGKVFQRKATSLTCAGIAENVAILFGILNLYNNVSSGKGILYPTLKNGSTGTWVKALQKALGSLEVDGDFGANTESAVKKFQKKNKLEVDGQAGPITLKKLGVKIY